MSSPSFVYCEGSAIKYQFILSSYQIDINHGKRRFSDPLTYNLMAQIQLAHVVRRGIQYQQHVRSCRLCALGWGRLPYVLANIDAEFYAFQFKYTGIRTGSEITLFVENAVIGKQLFEISCKNFPFA